MYIGVFCASADHIQEAYFRDAAALGEGIAKRGWNLVYGGTNCGLMHKTAEAVLAHGGKAVGVIPECIQMRGVAAEGITELLTAPDMKERKQLMRERADAFIALPGGDFGRDYRSDYLETIGKPQQTYCFCQYERIL